MTDEEKKAAEEAAAKEAAEKEAAEKAAAEEAARNKDKVKFNAEQTKFINELYSKAFREGAEKIEQTMKAQLDEEKKQREALAKQIEELSKTKPKEEPKTNPELDQFKAQLAEMQGILTGIKTERDELKKRVESAETERRKSQKKDLFLNATKDAKVTFFDPLEAYELAEKDGYEWDHEQDRPVVINKDTKRPKLNENGEAMSVIDFVKDFANRKKYLVQAPQAGGSGSAENRNIEPPKDKQTKGFNEMTDEEFRAYTEKVMYGQK
jgi:translation initiation factor 4G